MNLIIPSVGSENGPTYAYDINSSLSLIDQHNHSAGQGVQITPAGLNINADLPFNTNAATNVSYLSMHASVSPTTTVQAISSATVSSINELFYTDSNGTTTQLTANGTVNATVSSITGVTYSSGNFIFNTISGGVGTTTPAGLDCGPVIVRPVTAGTTNGVTINPPAGLGSLQNLYLPSTPASTFLLTMTNGGVIGANGTVDGTTLAFSGTTLSVANGGITSTQIATGTVAVSNMAAVANNQTTGSPYSTSSTSYTTVVSEVVVLATRSRPIFVTFSGGGFRVAQSPMGNYIASFQLICTGLVSTALATWTIEIGAFTALSPGEFNWCGLVNAGASNTVTLTLQAKNSSTSTSMQSDGVTMNVIQV